MIKKAIKNFFELEAATGIILFIATAASLFVANSDGYNFYSEFFNISLPINIDFINLYKDLSLRDWINDALMAIFFFLIGLELKKEVLIGHLSTKEKLAFPAIAAVGGVVFPALIFAIFNYGNDENLRAFAVPTATDIAFTYGILCLFGKSFSNSLKIFIVALAVIDDLIAIVIIAFFYTQELKLIYLVFSALPLLGLYLLNQKKSNKISLYVILGLFLWLMVLKSGIHATIAGVIAAIFIPLKIRNEKPLEKVTHKIAPMINFLILPVFAFANSGIKIANFSFDTILQPLVSGVICGMFFGKQIGIMLFSFIAVSLKISSLPSGTNWKEFYAASIFTGIGFTMSIFIAGLAFVKNDTIAKIMLDEVKLAILIGSILSILYGSLVTLISKQQHRQL